MYKIKFWPRHKYENLEELEYPLDRFMEENSDLELVKFISDESGFLGIFKEIFSTKDLVDVMFSKY